MAPDAASTGEAISAFRERIQFEPTGLVANHEQQLYGLRYATTAWRLGDEDPFHEELGYWLWDFEARRVMRCCLVPRGVTVIAGGSVEPGATSFELVAELGAETFGICSNPFLDRAFRTVRCELHFEKRGADAIHYREDTVLRVRDRDELFHHRDENTLERVDSGPPGARARTLQGP